jgi:hypothetical protein
MKEMCCICGKELPNRWAVAGRCKDKGCDVPFCKLHWRNGNKLCREHGWREPQNLEQGMSNNEGRGGGAQALRPGDEAIAPPINKQPSLINHFTKAKGQNMSEENNDNMDLSTVPEKQGKKAMEEAIKVAKAAGAGVAGLVAKIQYARSPQAMQDTLNDNLEKNTARREVVSAKLESVHNRIVTLKQQYEAAPPARKRTLQMELKTLMGEYKNLENEFKILLENETVLGKVRGRFMETLAYDLRGIKEKHIDKITDRIEDKADEADDIQDAMADLDRAGKRRDQEEDGIDFDAELAAFGDEEISMETGEELPASAESADEEKKKDSPEGLGEFE